MADPSPSRSPPGALSAPDRRRWLQRVLEAVVAVLALAGLGAWWTGLLGEKRRHRRVVRWSLEEVRAAGPGGQIGQGTLARWTPEGLVVWSLRCPHLGCGVRPDGPEFQCPCHGSRFDAEGRRLRGPAPRDLTRLQGRVRGDLWEGMDEG